MFCSVVHSWCSEEGAAAAAIPCGVPPQKPVWHRTVFSRGGNRRFCLKLLVRSGQRRFYFTPQLAGNVFSLQVLILWRAITFLIFLFYFFFEKQFNHDASCHLCCCVNNWVFFLYLFVYVGGGGRVFPWWTWLLVTVQQNHLGSVTETCSHSSFLFHLWSKQWL